MPREVSFKGTLNYWQVYLFVLPSLFLVLLFAYYPALSAMYHAFYRWNGEDINYFVGDRNFKRLLGNYWLWIAVYVMFYITLIYAKANDFKSNASRIASSLLFPSIGIALLAINKCFFVQNFAIGDAKKILVAGFAIWGTLILLGYLLISEENSRKWIYLSIPGIMLVTSLFRALHFDFVSSLMLVLFAGGLCIWLPKVAEKLPEIDTARTFHAFSSLFVCFWALAKFAGGDAILWSGFGVIAILIAFNIVKMIPSIITAVVINRLKSEQMNYFYKVLFVIPMIIPGMVYLLLWKFFFEPNIGIFNEILIKLRIMDILIWLDGKLGWGGIFKEGTMPVWLGNENLVIPAFIIWGFPWVGVVGVLLYLAGLQQIDKSIYEAAEIDGASSLQKFFTIELPLILTQIRVNMILMIIGTIQSYSFVLVLFGTEGGPNGKLMIPGLYMFRSAFKEGYAGYACAIGLILFFFILLLTELNNKYVKVEK